MVPSPALAQVSVPDLQEDFEDCEEPPVNDGPRHPVRCGNEDTSVFLYSPVAETTITVTATGTRTEVEDTGQAVTVIGQSEIEAVQGHDVTRVLTRAPGVTFARSDDWSGGPAYPSSESVWVPFARGTMPARFAARTPQTFFDRVPAPNVP